MKKIKNLEDLFHQQLQDIYSAEMQLVDALPKMVKKTTNKKLQKAFSDHLQETKEHVDRLEEIGDTLNLKISGETCKAMKGLISEAQSFISEDADDNARDAGIIANAQRIEHYEIAAYGTVVELAKALGKRVVAQKLTQSLDEEYDADDKLSELAIDAINVRAKV